MTEAIRINIIDAYSKNIELIGNIIDSIYVRIYKSENQIKWYNSDDLRSGIFQKYTSALINEKTQIYLLLNFISSDGFIDQYNIDIMPQLNKNNLNLIPYLLHNLDVNLRFDFFLKFYSQFESFIRVIYRKHNLKKDPFASVFKFLSIDDDNFLTKIDTIRNSVHNAGFHIPLPSRNQTAEYRIGNSKYTLNSGDPIQMDWDETLSVINEIIDYTFKIVETDLISNDK